MLDFPPYFVLGAAIAGASYLVSLWFQSATYKLRHIPTLGSSSLIGSYFDGHKFAKHGHELIREGVKKYKGGIFKIADMGDYKVIVTGQDQVSDIRRARDDQLSFDEAVKDTIQQDYTLGAETRQDPFHIPVVRTPLTRALAARFPEIKDEIIEAFNDFIPPNKEWTSYHALPTVMHIVARTSNRLFVGLPLCRNPEYRKLNETFAIEVIQSARTINRFPTILKPLVGRLLTSVPERIRRASAFIQPILEERLKMEEEFGPDWPDKPNDLITWLLEAGEGEQRSVRNIAIRTLSINFAAIHTTTMAFTNILYDLAAHPQYAEPMRQEVLEVIASDGWTKVSQGKMRRVDSFVKESQRINVSALNIVRRIMKDFTFSNGVQVPAGSIVVTAAEAAHFDEANYTNPDVFDGFRFSNLRDEDGEGTKHQTVALTPDFVIFGTGRHACPGRFFAVNELKTMLAHVLLNYDVKLADEKRPENIWQQAQSSPNPSAKVLFRKRAT
jgi:cytochrome P450